MSNPKKRTKKQRQEYRQQLLTMRGFWEVRERMPGEEKEAKEKLAFIDKELAELPW